ncbi:hydroxyproline-rich glycoprotein family protein [Raphanus sativus]|uniref:Adhesin AWP1-like n=1 Tax=Raphanus sativus TaxID=3726 RepID=A0A6J0L677_RAPSA|nr:adhesin AWP1-like [Raphanus sativus]KAJ4913163.1 hydroxyproline-rich glycoprotein family protein [Raphanus sativus]
MRNVNNTVETVNAAASAIVSAESRVQPSSAVQKKKWGSWWSLYWCFGSQKNNKRIGHAVLVPEPVASGSAPVAPVQTSSSNSASIFLPFITPPSSPASFLQSGPSSVSHTPHNSTGLLSFTGRNEPASAFAIGPYANETQPVTPPVDSAVATAPYTPPPESGQVSSCATPSSPEVPFAQLLTSSLERARRNGGGGVSRKFSAGHYEFRSHQVYPGSPGGGNLISPGSVVSNSGASSPYLPGKCSIVEFRVGEPPKFLGFEHFTARKWGSRFGSGSITPAGGQGSRLGSGALTPDGGGSGGGLGSKLASGAVTPNGGEMVVVVGSLLDSQISEVASLANSDDDVSSGGAVAHRVSFELTGEDVARCFASKLYGVGLDDGLLHEKGSEDTNKWSDSVSGNELSQKLKTFSLGSSKEFKFDNTKEEMIEKTAEWWVNEKVAGKGDNSWSFFPVLRSGGFS